MDSKGGRPKMERPALTQAPAPADTGASDNSFVDSIASLSTSNFSKALIEIAEKSKVGKVDAINASEIYDDKFIFESAELRKYASTMYDFEGITVEAVMSIFLSHFVKCVAEKNMNRLYLACIVAIRLSFHQTKKVLDDDYSWLPLFMDMKIDGRDDTVTNWKHNKELNATAIRYLGQILIQSGAQLGKEKCMSIVKERGTMFQPVEKIGSELSEYQTICKAKYNEVGSRWPSIFESYRSFFIAFWDKFGTFDGATAQFEPKILYGILDKIAKSDGFKDKVAKHEDGALRSDIIG